MSRHPDPTDTLDPAVAADLDALDAALAGAPDPTWAALVREIRAEAPAPERAFGRALDARVATGFPRRPVWLRLPKLFRVAVPALACLLLLAGVGGIALTSLDRGGDEEGMSAATSAPSAGDPEAAGGGSVAAVPPGAERGLSEDAAGSTSSSSAGASVGPSPAPLGGPRKVERSTTLALTTDAGGLQDAADGIVRATQDLGGVVERSQVDRTPDGGVASFVLRVPTGRLDDALKRFGELADVARLSEGAQDVTRSFVSAQDRLSDARAERKALLTALGKATTPRSIASLRARIRGNRAQIARLEGDLRGLRRRTDTARVDVSLSAGGAPVDPGAGGAWGPRDALDDAVRILEVVGGVLLVTAAVLLPFALLVAAAGLAAGMLRRRRREAALGHG